MTSPLTEKKYVEDLVKAEWDQRYSREEVTIVGVDGAGSQTFDVGTILKASSTNYTPCVSGDTTAAIAVLSQRVAVVDSGTATVGAITGGPILLDKDQLITPATTNKAAQIAALKALGIRTWSEPTAVETITV